MTRFFTSENGLRFQMKCMAKMENVFACGGLMAYFPRQNFRDSTFFSYFEPC